MVELGYWSNSDNVKKEISNITNKLDHYPTRKELTNINTGLSSTVEKHYGGLREFKEKMGYGLEPFAAFWNRVEGEASAKNSSSGYWKNTENIKKEIYNSLKSTKDFANLIENSEDLKKVILSYGTPIPNNLTDAKMFIRMLRESGNYTKEAFIDPAIFGNFWRRVETGEEK